MKKIKHLNIELTKRCNQNCFYCFNNSGNGNISDELSLNKWKIILSKLKKNGLKSVHFTGGEPFLYNNIIGLIEYSLNIGLKTSVLSNGLNVEILAKKYNNILSKLRVAQISLDTMYSKKNNQRRGYKNAYNDAISSIETFTLLGVPVEISSTVTDDNIDDLLSIGKYAKSINAKLLLRPCLKKGKGKFIELPKGYQSKFNKVRKRLQKEIKVLLIDDKFKYLESYEVEKISNKLNNFTILPNGRLLNYNKKSFQKLIFNTSL